MKELPALAPAAFEQPSSFPDLSICSRFERRNTSPLHGVDPYPSGFLMRLSASEMISARGSAIAGWEIEAARDERRFHENPIRQEQVQHPSCSLVARLGMLSLSVGSDGVKGSQTALPLHLHRRRLRGSSMASIELAELSATTSRAASTIQGSTQGAFEDREGSPANAVSALPPVDRGRGAWAFLAAATVCEVSCLAFTPPQPCTGKSRGKGALPTLSRPS